MHRKLTGACMLREQEEKKGKTCYPNLSSTSAT